MEVKIGKRTVDFISMTPENQAESVALLTMVKKVYSLDWSEGWCLKRPSKGVITSSYGIEEDLIKTRPMTGLDIHGIAKIVKLFEDCVEIMREAPAMPGGEGEVTFTGRLRDSEYDMLRDVFNFTIMLSGEPTLLVRTSQDNKELLICEDDETGLSTLLCFNPEAYEKLDAVFKESSCHIKEVKENSKGEKAEITWDLPAWYKGSKVGERVCSDTRCLVKEVAKVTNKADVYTYTYFDLEALKNLEGDPTPEFDEWILQMPEGSRPVFRAWLYSVLVEGNIGRQIMTLVDKGETGKTSFVNALIHSLGLKFVVSLGKDALGNQFAGSKIYGKGLAIFDDTGNSKLSMMDKIKMMTGNSYGDVEYKGKSSFTAIMATKVMCTTNSYPQIHLHEKNQLSRNIIITLTRSTDKKVLRKFCAWDMEKDEPLLDPNGNHIGIGSSLAADLSREMLAVIAKSRADFEKLCPNNGSIILGKSVYDEIDTLCASDTFIDFSKLFDNYLLVGDGLTCSSSVVKNILSKHNKKASEDGETTHTLKDFILFLEYRGGVRGVYRGGNLTVRGYTGIGLNSSWEEDEETGRVRRIENSF